MNKKWQPTKEKRAHYIREILQVSDTVYQVKEFTNDTTLIMEGEFWSVEPMVENGHFVFYNSETGFLTAEGDYFNGEMVGKWKFVNQNEGYSILNYDIPERVCEEPEFYHWMEIPKFNGEDPSISFRKYIQSNIVYPPQARKYKLEGRVIVQFTLDETGDICNIKVVRGISKEFDKEAIRVIDMSPAWNPAKRGDTPVRMMFTFPVGFELDK